MSAADDIALPCWALNQEGHALVEQLIRDRAEPRLVRDDWGGRYEYSGWKQPAVAGLKRLYRDWWETNYDKTTERPETADEFIERVLRETRGVPYTRMSITERPDGSSGVAA